MNTIKNKKIIYVLSSVCAVFILGIGIFVGTGKLNNEFQNDIFEIGKTEAPNGNKTESVNVILNINQLKDMEMTKLDVDVQTITMKSLPKKFEFIKNITIPEEYKLEESYNIYTRKDKDVAEYNVLHDYVFYYRKEDLKDIKITFSEIEKPVRDYYIEGVDKVSKIGDVELIISKWQQMYIVTFEHKNIYFDIETTGITENELVELLQSIVK